MAEPYLRGFESEWCSERLVFRAIQQEDCNFFCDHIDTDPVNAELSGPMLLKPPRRQNAEGGTRTAFSWTVICLRPDAQPNEKHPKISAARGKDIEMSGVQGDSKLEPRPVAMINVSASMYGRNPSSCACSLGIAMWALLLRRCPRTTVTAPKLSAGLSTVHFAK
jgi:hypothetical protein